MTATNTNDGEVQPGPSSAGYDPGQFFWSTRVKGPSLAGTLTWVTLRALDLPLQLWFLRSGAVNVLRRLGATTVPQPINVNTGTMLGLSPYHTLIFGLAVGSTAYNTVLNIANTLLAVWAVTTQQPSDQSSWTAFITSAPFALQVGMALYAVGLGTEWYCEVQRKAFKQDPANKGKPFYGGLFGLARNINYGGYTLWRAGYSLICGGIAPAVVVASWLAGDFCMRAIPSMDAYCEKRYGEQWQHTRVHGTFKEDDIRVQYIVILRVGMEDGVSQTPAVVDSAVPVESPPPPPDPNLDDATATVPLHPSKTEKSDIPLQLSSEHWNIDSVSALGALRMLVEALERLADATGNVPPTPPVSRPTTPRRMEAERAARRPSSTPFRAAGAGGLPALEIGSPEAHPHEPITVDVGSHAEDIAVQHAAIARRFFSKTAPPFSLNDYLLRFHHFCPHSPGVYLAAVSYIYQLCVSDLMVPATDRTIHRLSLAAIRVAAKALEDNKWAQERVAKVGGVSGQQLLNLEVTLCFLLDFELFIDEKIMARRMFMLQEAARQNVGARGRLSEQFKLRLPMRVKGIK
ncbi:unnamed protein product [Zymoseptoria tritici ST99CH_1A5]|nr:unnamed protein product [Zymoseptoria tritici ST99CH_1A5]